MLARQLRNNGTQGASSQQALPKVLLFAILYANQAKATPQDSLSRWKSFHLSFRQEGNGQRFQVFRFLNKQLQVNIPKGSSSLAKLWSLQYVFKSTSGIQTIIMFSEQVLTIVRIQRVAPRCICVVRGSAKHFMWVISCHFHNNSER